MSNAEKQLSTIKWFAEKLQNNELNFKTQVQLFDLLMKKLNVMSISEYGRQKGISYNGVLSKIQTGSLNALMFYGETMVFEEKKGEIIWK